MPHTPDTRLTWPDLARGVAVVSMLIAHTAPVGGILNLSEFLTAPLFAMIVGISLWLDWTRRGVHTRHWVPATMLRGLSLVILGELIQPIYGQILVVLQTLGLLMMVMALIVPFLAKRPAATGGLAVVVIVVGPLLMNASQAWLQAAPRDAYLHWIVDQLAAGANYRLSSFLVFGLAGMVLTWTWHHPRRTPTRTGLAAVALTVLAGAVFVWGRSRPEGLLEYSGTHTDIVFCLLLSAAVVAWCAWFTTALPHRLTAVAEPLVSTGKMTLTVYVGQLVLLAYLVLTFGLVRDDHWWVLITLIVSLTGFSWLWIRLHQPRLLEPLVRWPRLLEAPRP